MIPIQVKVISYDKDTNTCEALFDGQLITFDPFVGCAIELSDEDYRAGRGADIVGNTYVLTRYTVYTDCVCPNENGMHLA